LLDYGTSGVLQEKGNTGSPKNQLSDENHPFAAGPTKMVDGTAELPVAGFAWRRSSPKAAAIAISSQVTVRVHHLKLFSRL
jgi:hypothetical protein